MSSENKEQETQTDSIESKKRWEDVWSHRLALHKRRRSWGFCVFGAGATELAGC